MVNSKVNDATYDDALAKAQRELAECEVQMRELEVKRAKLRQTVAVLASLTGAVVPQERSLTEAVLMAVKASPGYVVANQVVELLAQMGIQAQRASVATILCRLSKRGDIAHAIGPNAEEGYTWKTETTKVERLLAKRELLGKAAKK